MLSEGSPRAPRPPPAVVAVAGYIAFHAALLSQLPRKGALPGNVDTWIAIALTNTYVEQATQLLTGIERTSSLYPATSPFGYGESSLGFAALLALTRAAASDDVWGYYFFLVMVFSAAALGVFLIASRYCTSSIAAWLSGLLYTSSAFTLGNIDDPVILALFPASICICGVLRALDRGGERLSFYCALGGLQAYFSAYVFLFQTVALACLALFRVGQIRHLRPSAGLRAVALYVTIAAPFFGFYFASIRSAEFFNPWDPLSGAEMFSLDPPDFERPLPGNLLYKSSPFLVSDLLRLLSQVKSNGFLESLSPEELDSLAGAFPSLDETLYYVYTRRCAFLGYAVLGLALLGAWSLRGRPRAELLTIAVAGLVLSLGPWLEVGVTRYATATYALHAATPLAMLRVPLRAFFLTLLVLAVFAGIGLERIGGRIQPASARVAVLLALFCAALIENVPFPLPSFEAARFQKPPDAYLGYFEDRPDAVVLNVPTAIGATLTRSHLPFNEYSREAIYMNWQTYHHANSPNGVNGYFPRHRVDLHRLVKRAFPADGCRDEEVNELRAMFGVTHIAFNAQMALSPTEHRDVLGNLLSCRRLRLELHSGDTRIFRLLGRAAGGPEDGAAAGDAR